MQIKLSSLLPFILKTGLVRGLCLGQIMKKRTSSAFESFLYIYMLHSHSWTNSEPAVPASGLDAESQNEEITHSNVSFRLV